MGIYCHMVAVNCEQTIGVEHAADEVARAAHGGPCARAKCTAAYDQIVQMALSARMKAGPASLVVALRCS